LHLVGFLCELYYTYDARIHERQIVKIVLYSPDDILRFVTCKSVTLS